MKRVLIANRGEIAVRISRSLRELGIETVTVYSEADVLSPHVRHGDFAVALKGRTSAESYLDIERILEACQISGADALHPGYGFLSENEAFARRVVDAGITFIGPNPQSMQQLGHKTKAKDLMKQHNVPVVPGSDGPLSSLEKLRETVSSIGFPIILKAASGGGGRGMRVVRQDGELAAAYEACTREAESYFGNPEVFCERYISNPRHIEVQVLCDRHGNGVHLNERDCSVQRRHQKLLEEAPSYFLSEQERSAMGQAAVTAALAASYEGAGTVEFICESPDKFYFMEMNTRIQVEHPVSELITGVDLIAEQVRVARGERLSFTQEDLTIHGWALEARINAERPLENFRPDPGLIRKVRWPAGPYVRVDTHVEDGYTVPSEYDSMIGKIIVWGRTRNEAIARLKRALSEFYVDGVATTALLHEAILDHPDFQAGEFDTGFIEHRWDDLKAHMNVGFSDECLPTLLAALGRSSTPFVATSGRDDWSRLEPYGGDWT